MDTDVTTTDYGLSAPNIDSLTNQATRSTRSQIKQLLLEHFIMDISIAASLILPGSFNEVYYRDSSIDSSRFRDANYTRLANLDDLPRGGSDWLPKQPSLVRKPKKAVLSNPFVPNKSSNEKLTWMVRVRPYKGKTEFQLSGMHSPMSLPVVNEEILEYINAIVEDRESVKTDIVFRLVFVGSGKSPIDYNADQIYRAIRCILRRNA